MTFHPCLAWQWSPTKQSYLRFLVESKAVYDAMETVMQSDHPACARSFSLNKPPSCPLRVQGRPVAHVLERPVADTKFKSTGLERSAPLARDIEWFASLARALAGPRPRVVLLAVHVHRELRASLSRA